MEIITKIDEYTVEITPEPIQPESVNKTLEELEADLAMAVSSKEYILKKHQEELAPVDETIALMQKKIDDAKTQGIVKPEPVVESIEEIPIK